MLLLIQNILSSQLISKSAKNKIYRAIILPASSFHKSDGTCEKRITEENIGFYEEASNRGCKTLYEELNNSYYSPNISRVIK